MNPFLSQFASLENQYGLPTGYLGGTFGIESNFGRAKDRPGSQYQGPFQLGGPVRMKYGVSNPTDVLESARAAAALGRDNMKYLQGKGLPVTASNLYLAHQQGAGGAAKLLGNPNTPAGMLTNPEFIRANGGDPNAPAAAFQQRFGDMFGNKAAAFAGQEPPPGAGSPINAVMGAPQPPATPELTAPATLVPGTPKTGWDTASQVGNGLVGLGAALQSIDNPSGAHALMGLRQPDTSQPQYLGMGKDNKMVMVKMPDGSIQALPTPASMHTNEDMPSQIKTLEALKARPDLMDVYQGMHPKDAKTDLSGTYTPEEAPQLKTMADLFQRDKGALSRMSEASRAKLFKYMVDNNIGGGDIAAGQVQQASDLAAGRDLGRMVNKIDAFGKTFETGANLALEASAELPRGNWKGWNEVSQKALDQVSDPTYANFHVRNDTAAREFAKAMNPLGQPSVTDFNHARDLLSTADGPEAYKTKIEALKTEISRNSERLRGLQGSFKERVANGHKEDTPSPETSAPQATPTPNAIDPAALAEARRRGLIK